ncbi:MAG: hypothetical protein HC851_19585 [Acaryochloris sp. RU_4_1]|nr:hypothetical protein [Acaryochloris sp. RU_4_1]NJR57169.1 hypothetical protein [Acaryochloris sp. CRU_2_0]
MAVKRIKIDRETKDTTTLYRAIAAIEYVYGTHAVKDTILDLAELLMLPYAVALNGGTQEQLEQAILQAEDRAIRHVRRSHRYWGGGTQEAIATLNLGVDNTPVKANGSISYLASGEGDYQLDDDLSEVDLDC